VGWSPGLTPRGGSAPGARGLWRWKTRLNHHVDGAGPVSFRSEGKLSIDRESRRALVEVKAARRSSGRGGLFRKWKRKVPLISSFSGRQAIFHRVVCEAARGFNRTGLVQRNRTARRQPFSRAAMHQTNGDLVTDRPPFAVWRCVFHIESAHRLLGNLPRSPAGNPPGKPIAFSASVPHSTRGPDVARILTAARR